MGSSRRNYQERAPLMDVHVEKCDSECGLWFPLSTSLQCKLHHLSIIFQSAFGHMPFQSGSSNGSFKFTLKLVATTDRENFSSISQYSDTIWNMYSWHLFLRGPKETQEWMFTATELQINVWHRPCIINGKFKSSANPCFISLHTESYIWCDIFEFGRFLLVPVVQRTDATTNREPSSGRL